MARRSLQDEADAKNEGWGGYRVLQSIDKRRYDVTVISPNAYFNFTPLLASTAVGTLEFRCATEPVRRYGRQINYHQAWADNIDVKKKQILCTPSTRPLPAALPSGAQGNKDGKDNFVVPYDKLVIAVGAYSQTFGTEGVKEHGTFLKDVSDARRIRMRVLECFEQAAQPTLTDMQRRGLLHFACVGGGPTSIEFAAELHGRYRL
jgi:NADH dehydrogenase FAD-containing subunit